VPHEAARAAFFSAARDRGRAV